MNLRTKFKNRLKESCIFNDFEIDAFNRFFRLNETPVDDLTELQNDERIIMRDRLLDDDDKREKYYRFHLDRLFDTKWRGIGLKRIVTEFYRNSESIREIYEGVK